ncbi:MAG: helix-turn-helix domain-containing protein [Lactobacillaceae bacterium]|jgi:transcriptional regulator with XRE-family HTH domain|nr:helix-turn-helix domain-containing protein [Lactobacillaceae bacterium]
MVLPIGEKIKELRIANGWSQGDLATRVMVARQSVSKWENNITIPDIETLIQLSELFNISLDDLLKNMNEKRALKTFNQTKKKIERPFMMMLWIQSGLIILMFFALGWLILK